ncbi:MAG: hypothetical protein ACFFBZ_14940 [Promethearchaeota archaeon]
MSSFPRLLCIKFLLTITQSETRYEKREKCGDKPKEIRIQISQIERLSINMQKMMLNYGSCPNPWQTAWKQTVDE